MNNKIIIVAGDPNSINSEIIYKAWKKIDNKIKKRLYLIANYNLISSQYKKLKYKANVIKINNIEDNITSTNLNNFVFVLSHIEHLQNLLCEQKVLVP